MNDPADSFQRDNPSLTPAAIRVELADIQPLRALFLQETNFQIRYHACHERGWTDSYLLTDGNAAVGYGAIKGQAVAGRDTAFEFFVIPPFRKFSSLLFAELLVTSGASFIECQSNDLLLTSLLFEFARDINATAVLFEDHVPTEHGVPGALVRRRRENDRIFEHQVEPPGEYVLVLDGEIVATGGYALHYNPPFADLYLEVREDCRRCGFASFLLQELKRACYLAGRVPAARCGLRNVASRGALTRAGMRVCGFMLTGRASHDEFA